MVPSAPGKRDSKDDKITDLLYKAYEAAASGASYKKIYEKIKSRYRGIIEGFKLNLNFESEFDICIMNAVVNWLSNSPTTCSN